MRSTLGWTSQRLARALWLLMGVGMARCGRRGDTSQRDVPTH